MRYYNKLADGGWNYSFVDPEMDKQFLNAASSRQGRFDKSNAMLQEQLTKLGETETFNPDQLQGRVSQLQDKVNQSIQDRYQGDYGAGANEIIRQLSAERRDPFYGMNKEQVRQGRLYDQARLKDPQNFIGLNDPRSVDISQTGATMDQLRPDYTSRTNDPKYVKERFSAAGNAVVDRIKNNSALPGYFEQIQNKGLSALDQEDWDEILSDSAVDDYIRESSYMKDPNIAEEDKTQEGAKAHLKDVMTGVYASQQQSKFIGDKAYDARLKAKLAGNEPNAQFNAGVTRGVNNPNALTNDEWDTGKNLNFLKQHKRDAVVKNILNGDSGKNNGLLAKYGYSSDTKVDELLAIGGTKGVKYSVKTGLQRVMAERLITSVMQNPNMLNSLDKKQQELVSNIIEYQNEHPDDPNYKSDFGLINNEAHGVNNITELASLMTPDKDKIISATKEVNKASRFKKDYEKSLKSNYDKNKTVVGQFKTRSVFTPYTKLNTATRTRLKDVNEYVSNNLDLRDFEFVQSNFPTTDFDNQDKLLESRDADYNTARKSGNLSLKGVESLPDVGMVLRVETKDSKGMITEHIIRPIDKGAEADIANAMYSGNDEELAKHNLNKSIYDGNNYLNNDIPSLIDNGIISPDMTFRQSLTVIRNNPDYSYMVKPILASMKHNKIKLDDKYINN